MNICLLRSFCPKKQKQCFWVSLPHLVGSRWLCLQKSNFYRRSPSHEKKNSWYLCFQACRVPITPSGTDTTTHYFCSNSSLLFRWFPDGKGSWTLVLVFVWARSLRNTVPGPKRAIIPSLFLLTAGLRRSQLVTELLLVVAVGHQSSLLWPGWALTHFVAEQF